MIFLTTETGTIWSILDELHKAAMTFFLEKPTRCIFFLGFWAFGYIVYMNFFATVKNSSFKDLCSPKKLFLSFLYGLILFCGFSALVWIIAVFLGTAGLSLTPSFFEEYLLSIFFLEGGSLAFIWMINRIRLDIKQQKEFQGQAEKRTQKLVNQLNPPHAKPSKEAGK